jgi:hypothetical protein
MSAALVPNKRELARREQIAAGVVAKNEEKKVNPLLMIPSGAITAVNFFIAANLHLNISDLAIATRVQWWMEREGLSLDGLKRAFTAMCRPDRQCRHEHAGVLMADLTSEVDRILKQERQAERDQQFQDEVRRWEKEKAPTEVVQEMVRKFRDFSQQPPAGAGR